MSAKIPQIQSDDRKFNQYQQNVAKALQLLLNCPLNYGVQLTNVALVASQSNNVPHTLNRRLQGWFIARQRVGGSSSGGSFVPNPSAVGIQDNQDRNPTPDKTLVLYVTEDVNVDIWVY